METLLALFVLVILLALLALLCQGLLLLMNGFAWACILLIGVWVGANIGGILYLERLGRDSPLLAAVHRAWSGLFYYTALLQAVIFTVMVFWFGALLFRDGISAPATRVEFVTDFVKGSTAIAGLLFLGVLLSAFSDLGLAGRIGAGLYAIAVAAVVVAPWLPVVQLEARAAAHPGQVFWLTLAAYALLSTAGMALYDASMKVVPPTAGA